MDGLLIAGVMLILLIGIAMLFHYLGKQAGYEHGFNDGEEVGYVEGYLAKNAPKR
jgi:hypothetical protein